MKSSLRAYMHVLQMHSSKRLPSRFPNRSFPYSPQDLNEIASFMLPNFPTAMSLRQKMQNLCFRLSIDASLPRE